MCIPEKCDKELHQVHDAAVLREGYLWEKKKKGVKDWIIITPVKYHAKKIKNTVERYPDIFIMEHSTTVNHNYIDFSINVS